jgi:hypothetical protein
MGMGGGCFFFRLFFTMANTMTRIKIGESKRRMISSMTTISGYPRGPMIINKEGSLGFLSNFA